jgi:HEAT repeat protein
MPPNLVELCAPLADNSSHEVRTIAINLLGKSADPRAAPALRNCLKTLSLPNDRARALEALCNVLNKDALPDLVAAIDDRDPEVRQFAENRLQFSIDGNSIGFLIQLLDNAATTKRLMAAGALSRLAFSERFVVRQATPALMIRVAAEPEYEVRRQALDALTKLNDPRAGVLFLALLDQNDEPLRRLALTGLINLAIERVLDPATALEPVTRVVHASRDTQSRCQALETLYRLGSPEAWQVITDMADDADPKVQQKLKNMRYFIQNRSRTRSR